MWIRSFAFLANCHRTEKLALFRQLLACEAIAAKLLPGLEPTEAHASRCPHCGEYALHLIAETACPSLRTLIAATCRGRPPDSI